MSNAIWREPKPTSDEQYPLKLLKGLMQSMLKQVPVYGACLALYDESINQMVVRLHLRRNEQRTDPSEEPYLEVRCPHLLRQKTGPLENGPATGSLASTTCAAALFPPGSSYPPGQDMIGVSWRDQRSYRLHHEQYQILRTRAHQQPIAEAFSPTWYLTLPLKPSNLMYEEAGLTPPQNHILGVIVLYETTSGGDFPSHQRLLAEQQAERINLYLQNDQLMRLQRRTKDHIQHLQQIGCTFPNSLKLSDLVEEVYRFVVNTVDISSMLFTLYDRDTKKLYDIFAVNHGRRIEGLANRPVAVEPDERPYWWQLAYTEKRTLLLSRDELEHGDSQAHAELLSGTWGDQTDAETMLLIPMKMFTRVVGSLALTSQRPQAYGPLEVLVLETMMQTVTVAIENTKLYERPRLALQQSKRREETLALTVSALQSISTVLNMRELLHKIVESVANLVQVEMCSFFELERDSQELVAKAIFDRTGKWNAYDSAPSPEHENHQELRDGYMQHYSYDRARSNDRDDDIIQMIHLPFSNSALETLVEESFFYLDKTMLEDLAQASSENGALFLHEILNQKMLLIPLRYYQTELLGILVIHTPQQDRIFQPEEISVLMAISAQATNAIANARLFEQIEDKNLELERMNRIKDEFIMTASHELRTPLSAISGYSSLLKKQSENERVNPQQVLKYANKIVGSTQQLTDLVENMTQAARMGALEKNLTLDLVSSHLLSVAQTATTMLNISLPQPIAVTIPANLWVSSNTMHLCQVITNLLDNAAKYSPEQGRIEIKASALRLSELPEEQMTQVEYDILAGGENPQIVKVSVCDEGEGITSEDAEKIFEKFVRASRSLTTSVRGTGLGLFICRRFIEAMGGRLWLERSIPGQGSIFSFYLQQTHPAEMRELDDTEPESDPQEAESLYATAERAGRR